MQRSTVLTALIAAGLGGAGGYWLGVPSATDQPVHAPVAATAAPAVAAAPASSTAPNPFLAGTGAAGAQAKAAEGEGDTEAFDDPRIALLAQDQALASVEQLSALLSGDPATPGREQAIQALKQALLDKAGSDSLALQGVIDAFRGNPGSELGEHLGALLSEIRDPEVEQAARDMVRSGSPDQMAAGLQVLGGLGIPSQETLDLTRQLVSQPGTDPALLMGAIHAMPVMALSREQTEQTIGSLAHLAHQHPDAGVRSNSLFKIAEWARDGQDLQPLMQALDKQRTPDDRISAAMALAQSSVTSDELRRQALARMTDKSELWEVRRYAAEALGRFKLSGQDFQLLEDFRREQVDVQNNG